MSYAAERWARSQKVGNASAKFVLIELANALNRESGKCFPSIDALQKEALQKPSLILRPENFCLLHKLNFCANDCSGYF